MKFSQQDAAGLHLIIVCIASCEITVPFSIFHLLSAFSLVLKKSQREANNLAQRCGKEKNHVIHGQANTNSSSKLEADLTNHWKSLFLSMEGIFVHESSQLVSVTFSIITCTRVHDITELEVL